MVCYRMSYTAKQSAAILIDHCSRLFSPLKVLFVYGGALKVIPTCPHPFAHISVQKNLSTDLYVP